MMEAFWKNCKGNPTALYMLAVFAGLVLFFTAAHPLVPYDGDDWVNLGNMRTALPKVGAWNPSKILPETSFPFIGFLAAYVVTPLIGDYVDAITLTAAVVYSGVIALYLWLFTSWIRGEMELTAGQSLAVSFCFLLAHFWIFKTAGMNQRYLFSSVNLTCIFHYSIPGIVNASLVLYAWKHRLHGGSSIWKDPWKGGVFLLAVYLAIYSNALSDMNLVMYLAVLILWQYKEKLFTPRGMWRAIKENPLFITVLLLWLAALAFEATGGRAKSIGVPFTELPIRAAAINLLKYLKGMNHAFLALSAAAVLLASAGCLRRRGAAEWNGRFMRGAGICISAGLLAAVYLILVAAKANPGYVSRADVVFNIVFWGLLILSLAFAWLLKTYGKLMLFMPLLLVCITMELLKGYGGYIETNMGNIPPSAARAISRDLVTQIVEADRAGKAEMTLVVPKGNDRDNWPHPKYMGGNIARTLYRHGLVTKIMKIEIKPDTEMNVKYHIPIPKK